MSYLEINVWNKYLPVPTIAVSTGRGAQLYWKLEHLPKQGYPLWSKVEQQFATKMDEHIKQFNSIKSTGYEVDFACTDVTRVFHIIDTRNSKSNTQAKMLFKKEDKHG